MKMLPWQFANIQALDVNLEQVALEGDDLYQFIFRSSVGWHPAVRHKGVLVAPHVGLRDREGGCDKSCGFTLLPTEGNEDRVALTDALKQMRLPPHFVPPPCAMRLQRARPLVHLTLRLTAWDWWTWADGPTSSDAEHHHLGLEPGAGSGYVNGRPTSVGMQELAQQRRDGTYYLSRAYLSVYTPGWAYIMAEMPDLKSLEIVMEIFGEKKDQLETGVECAKTWLFPLAGKEFELAWSGRVTEMRSSKPLLEDYNLHDGDWYARSTHTEVRVIRFTKRQMANELVEENYDEDFDFQ